MPGDFQYLDDSGIVVTTYWGTISLIDILETISQRVGEMPVHRAKASIIDVSQAKWTDAPPNFVHKNVAQLRPALAPPRVRTIIVAPSEFFYGFGRMYALMHVIFGAANVDVARSWSEASRMLGMNLASAERLSRERAKRDESEIATMKIGRG